MSISFNGLQGAGAANLGSVDIETALAMVQSQRANLLEDQLKGQLATVEGRNQQIAAMNENMAAKRNELGELEAALSTAQTNPAGVTNERIQELQQMRDQLQKVLDRDPNGWTGLSWGWAGDNQAKSHEMLERVKAEGLSNAGDAPRDVDGNGTMDAHGKTVKGWIDQINAKISGEQSKVIDGMKAQQTGLKNDIDKLKNDIDSASNSQQMEMLRLQSLSNKRNESFDVMTNFIKKMQENRSSIIGNMR